MPRVENHRNAVKSPFLPNRFQDSRCRRSVAIVGNQQSVGSASILAGGKNQFALQVLIRLGLRLAIDTNYLLRGIMRHPRKDARLGDGCITLVLQDSADRNSLVTEMLEQHPSWFIIA